MISPFRISFRPVAQPKNKRSAFFRVGSHKEHLQLFNQSNVFSEFILICKMKHIANTQLSVRARRDKPAIYVATNLRVARERILREKNRPPPVGITIELI